VELVRRGFMIGLTGFICMQERGAHLRAAIQRGVIPLKQVIERGRARARASVCVCERESKRARERERVRARERDYHTLWLVNQPRMLVAFVCPPMLVACHNQCERWVGGWVGGRERARARQERGAHAHASLHTHAQIMVETDAPYMRGDKAYYPISDTQSENTEGRGGGQGEGVQEEGGRDEAHKLLRAGQALSENSPKADLVSHIRKLETALRREIQPAGISEERRGGGGGGGSGSGLRAAPRPDVLIRNKKQKPRRDTEPADVVAVVRCLSALMGFPPHQVAKQTTANAARFFQLDIPARHPNKP